MLVSKIRCLDDRPDKRGMPMEPPVANERFDELKENVRLKGLLTPIAINSRNIVVFGHYRYLAAKALGWKEVMTEKAETVQDLGLCIKSGA